MDKFDWIIKRISKFASNAAMVCNGNVKTYQDILDRYFKFKKTIIAAQIEKKQVVAIRGEFSDKYFSLLLSLIENKNIILPLPSDRDENEYLEIANADKLVILNDNELSVKNIGTSAGNELYGKLNDNSGLILFSSGSAGGQKGILHDFEKLIRNYSEEKHAFTTILFLLADHIGGINTIFYTLLNGGTLVIAKTRNTKEICEIVEKYRIDLLPTTPTFLNMLYLSRAYADYDLSSLKLITYGTEVMQESVLKGLVEALPSVKFKQTYGLSELGILKINSEKKDSVWIRMDEEKYSCKIINDILHIKADTAMIGYLNAHDPFDSDGWFNTGDKVMKKNGYFRILGRESEIINIGGEKIYPAQIEDILIQIPGIKDVSVTGEPNQLMGQIISAKVNMDSEEDILSLKKRIREFCKGRLNDAFVPVKIQIVDKNLFNQRFKKIRR